MHHIYSLLLQIVRIRSSILYGAKTGIHNRGGHPGVIERFTSHCDYVYSKMRDSGPSDHRV